MRAIQKEDRRLVEDSQGIMFCEVILNDRKRKIYVDPNCISDKKSVTILNLTLLIYG